MRIVKNWKHLTIFTKSSIVDFRLGSEYTSAIRIIQIKNNIWTLLNIFKLYIFSINKYHCAFTNFSNTKTRGGSRTAVTSKMERFVIIVNGWKPLTIIIERSILHVAAALDPCSPRSSSPRFLNSTNDTKSRNASQ